MAKKENVNLEPPYNFGEKEYEYNDGVKVPVTMLPKYYATREKVIALLKDKKYADILNESDFWILKNFDKANKNCYYSGLIILHDALVKINDTLGENERFNQEFCSDPIPTNWNGKEGFRIVYRDRRDGMIEYGEISTVNCKNSYPFAMLLKRVFDRVVKRKAKLNMVYSDSEADEFRQPEEVKEEPKATDEQVEQIVKFKDVIMDELMDRNINNAKGVMELTVVEASKLCKMIDERLGEDNG